MESPGWVASHSGLRLRPRLRLAARRLAGDAAPRARGAREARGSDPEFPLNSGPSAASLLVFVRPIGLTARELASALTHAGRTPNSRVTEPVCRAASSSSRPSTRRTTCRCSFPRCSRRTSASRCWSSTTTRPTGPASAPTTSRSPTPRVHVLHRPHKQGLGPAYRAGIARALELGADCVAQMDADLSHPPEMLRDDARRDRALRRRERLALPRRHHRGELADRADPDQLLRQRVRAARRPGSRSPTPPAASAACGASCFERIGIERVRANGYAFQIELNYRFARVGARVKEIPFFFVDRRRGASKLSWRIGFEALWIAPAAARRGRARPPLRARAPSPACAS